jgi:hypothetical protein
LSGKAFGILNSQYLCQIIAIVSVDLLTTTNKLTLQPTYIIIASIFYTTGKHLVRFGCTDLGLRRKGLGGIEVALSALLFQMDTGNQNQPKQGSTKIGIKASAPKNNPNKSIPQGIKVALPTSRSSRKRGVPPQSAITTKAISRNIISNQPK